MAFFLQDILQMMHLILEQELVMRMAPAHRLLQEDLDAPSRPLNLPEIGF